MLQINANISTSGHGPKSRPELFVMNPNLNIFTVHEFVEAARMVEMEMADDAGETCQMSRYFQRMKDTVTDIFLTCSRVCPVASTAARSS